MNHTTTRVARQCALVWLLIVACLASASDMPDNQTRKQTVIALLSQAGQRLGAKYFRLFSTLYESDGCLGARRLTITKQEHVEQFSSSYARLSPPWIEDFSNAVYAQDQEEGLRVLEITCCGMWDAVRTNHEQSKIDGVADERLAVPADVAAFKKRWDATIRANRAAQEIIDQRDAERRKQAVQEHKTLTPEQQNEIRIALRDAARQTASAEEKVRRQNVAIRVAESDVRRATEELNALQPRAGEAFKRSEDTAPYHKKREAAEARLNQARTQLAAAESELRAASVALQSAEKRAKDLPAAAKKIAGTTFRLTSGEEISVASAMKTEGTYILTLKSGETRTVPERDVAEILRSPR